VAEQGIQQDSNPHEDTRKDREFKRCYLKNRERIYWYVMRRISSSEDAQDITADVFVKLYERMNKIGKRGDNALLAWLYTVARNSSIDYLRKQSNRKSRSIDNEEIDEAVKVFDDFVGEVLKEHDLADTHSALEKLDELERELIELRYEEGMKFNEIAEMVGKSEGACKMVLYRSLDKIRDELNQKHQQNAG